MKTQADIGARAGRAVFAIVLVAMLVLPCAALARDKGSVEASVDRTRIGQYEHLTLEVRVSSSGGSTGEPELPPMEEWEVVGQGSSTQIQIINFKKSVSHVYQYELLPLKTGSLRIPEISATIGGRIYKTRPINVTVVEAGAKSQGPELGEDEPRDDTYLRVVVEPEGEALVGQKILVSYYLVTRVKLNGWNYQRLPALEGFWSEPLETADRNGQLTGVEFERGGQRYIQALVRRYAVFPIAPGELTIDSLVLEVQQVVRGRRGFDPFEDMFGGLSRGREVTIASPPVAISISEPPAEGRPEGFAGAVGNFVVTAKTDVNALKAGEAITYRVKVAGDANAKSLAPPVLDLPDAFREYTPKESAEVVPIPHDYRMEKEFAYILVPEKEGDYTIPPARLSYFDPSSKTYRTAVSESIRVAVAPGIAPGPQDARPVLSKEQIRLEGEDIRYIKEGPVSLESRSGHLLSRPAGWILLALYPLVIAGVYAGSVVRERRSADVAGTRRRRAVGEARRRLKDARRLAAGGDPRAFFGELQRAVSRYVADKTGAGEAVLTPGDAAERLRARGVDELLVADVRDLLEHCDLYRFGAQAADDGAMTAGLDRAAGAIDALERAKVFR